MKIKALTAIETLRHIPQEDDDGTVTLRSELIEMKENDIADIDDKLAARLVKLGHASEDMDAETHLDRVRREVAQQATIAD